MSGFFSFDQDSRSINEDSDESCLPALSFKERLIAFCVCFGLSITIEVVSMGSILGIITGNPTRYALSMTLGNILSILGTGFLLGFKRQFKSAFDEKRRLTTVIFFSSMVLTLFSVYLGIAILTLLLIFVQFGSYIWYMASYFPWGRSILLRVCKSCFGRCCFDES